MRKAKWVAIIVGVFLVGFVFTIFSANIARSAYQHSGEVDSGNFTSVYPDKAGTKLDSCALCHTGSPDKTMGSCQWCHSTYGYSEPHGNIDDTLNPYGMDYKNAGRSTVAVQAIDNFDSDMDGYSNKVEIAAIRYPGDPNDTPAKVSAPYRVFTRDELEQMQQHTQFMLMNTKKSDDFYVEYTGVTLESLLQGITLDSATGIDVFAPDGFSTTHPFNPDPNFYHVFGTYPEASFYYDAEADISLNPDGWCDYSAPSVVGRINGDPIINPDGLKMILAIKRDGQYLDPGVLNEENKLDGEGPFRVVPPQKVSGPPDQKSTASNPNLIWPYDLNADHNAGFSTRTVTIIRVDPLPEGTTDIDTLEAGWQYVDEAKIVVYGSVDPVPTILEKLDALATTIRQTSDDLFKRPPLNNVLGVEVMLIRRQVIRGHYSGALEKLQNHVLQRTDGCVVTGAIDGNDWVTDCDIQKQLYWAINEIVVLLNIIL